MSRRMSRFWASFNPTWQRPQSTPTAAETLAELDAAHAFAVAAERAVLRDVTIPEARKGLARRALVLLGVARG